MGRANIYINTFCEVMKQRCEIKGMNQFNHAFVSRCEDVIEKTGSFVLNKASVSVTVSKMLPGYSSIDVYYSDKAYPDGPWEDLFAHHDDFCGPRGPKLPLKVLVAAGVGVAGYGVKRSGVLKQLKKLKKAPVIRKFVAPVFMITGAVAVVERGGGFFDVVGNFLKDGVCLFLGCNEAH